MLGQLDVGEAMQTWQLSAFDLGKGHLVLTESLFTHAY